MPIFKNDYPAAIPVTYSQLKSFYGRQVWRYADFVAELDFYILPKNTHGATDDEHCAGVRFSNEPSDYASLWPHLPSSAVEGWKGLDSFIKEALDA